MMRFLFQNKEPSLLLRQKFTFWEKLCELSSDRFGLLANRNIEKAISSFFKLISGLPKNVIDFDLDEFIRQNKLNLETHINEISAQSISHPIPSLRVISLDIFSRSEVYNKAVNNQKTDPDKKLRKNMSNILERFFFMGNETDVHRMRFIASSGLIMSQIDKEMTRDESGAIIDTLANYLLFPKQFLDEMIGSQKVNDIFNDSISNLLDPKKNRGSIEQEAEMMFSYLINIALSDNDITQAEIDFLNRIGTELFGFTKEKISYMTAEVIANNFQPSGI